MRRWSSDIGMDDQRPNALQRTRHDVVVCNPRVPCAGSLSLGLASYQQSLFALTPQNHQNLATMNAPALTGTLGIFLVAIGSIFVAYEVVQRFKGEKYEQTTTPIIGAPTGLMSGMVPIKVIGITQTKETEDFKKWEKRRNIVMGIGLLLILLGSFIQVIALWIT